MYRTCEAIFGFLMILVLVSACAHTDSWTGRDKGQFAALCAAQVGDFVTTKRHLARHPGNYIEEPWCRKYGDRRPSTGSLALVKLAELGLAYLIADALPAKYRPWFLMPVAGLLTWCAVGNVK